MFSIDQDQNITYSPGETAIGDSFATKAQLLALVNQRQWTKEEVTAIWNSFAGAPPFGKLKPLKRFRNRPYGVQKIWQAIQVLIPGNEPTVAAKSARRKAVADNGGAFRKDSKGAEIVRLLNRERGVSLTELVDELKWQRHTVRGFLSTLRSKHRLAIIAEKSESRGRVYRIAA